MSEHEMRCRHPDEPSDNPKPEWRQLNIAFAGSHRHAVEHAAATYLGPALADAEGRGLISSWFFIRKQPWKLRYLPADHRDGSEQADTLLYEAAISLEKAQQATGWRRGFYEPETHAFGGDGGMKVAHTFFHADSRHIFAHLTRLDRPSSPTVDCLAQRRELSLLLCTALMRAAGQDRYEQGDIWARLCRFRPHCNVPAGRQDAFRAGVECLIAADTGPDTPLRRDGLRGADGWFTAFERTGKALRNLAEDGHLTRGLRAVIVHHIIFHWNRIGLPSQTQANLAHAAAQIIFGH